ncbi:Propanediol dehydratase small subunit [Pelotomaculum schinkii]|uniref:Propanediol dehydratase small subunit n=1 Tax=Pelotomaculum schinkii TaxID=78350 RepID=A0A4Y7RIA0_9FIRM|nr:diol dehydratase small subunit [Pelotomaculum schinkii]TEB08533.1 Propanediol dehydratase small subunit [Pelotomaculum schinkii]
MSYIKQYPFAEKSPGLIKGISGKKLDEIDLKKIISGEIDNMDIRISPETLELQAKVAEEQGRTQFAANLRRAKELCVVPDGIILEIYDKLRPYRVTKKELLDIADDLETKYNATLNAELVREAVHHYEERGVLKSEEV